MDSTAYAIGYNVIYNRLKAQEQIFKIVVKETKL
tara:strand:- start:4814 stop:4915 length:102 start_codon:yes stop_codon:yes gene_type:complete